MIMCLVPHWPCRTVQPRSASIQGFSRNSAISAGVRSFLLLIVPFLSVPNEAEHYYTRNCLSSGSWTFCKLSTVWGRWTMSTVQSLGYRGFLTETVVHFPGYSLERRTYRVYEICHRSHTGCMFFCQIPNIWIKYRQTAEQYSAKQPNKFSPNSRKPLKWWIISHIISLNRRRNDRRP